MLELADHHVARPRLLRAHVVPPVQVIVGPAGSGKSSLVRELGLRAGTTVSLAYIDTTHVGPDAMLMRLRDGLRRVGNVEAADALTAPSASAHDSVDALLAHLTTSDDPVMLAIDGAHDLSSDATELLAHLASGIPEPHSLIVTARRLEGGLGRLRMLTSMMVVDDELAFTRSEAMSLLNEHLRLRLTPKTIAKLIDATSGSPLRLTIAGRWFARIQDPLARQDAIDAAISAKDVVDLVVDDLLASTSRRDRRAIIRLAGLSWSDERIAAAASTKAAILDLLVDAALATRDGAQVRMTSEAASALRNRGAPTSRRVLRRIAATFASQGDLRTGVRTLIDGGMEDHAAATLVARAPADIRSLSAADLQDLVFSLPEDVVSSHPRLLLQLSRAWHSVGRAHERHAALRRASELGEAVPERLRKAFEVERMTDEAGHDRDTDDHIRSRCADLLESLDPSAHDVRARLLEVVATVEIAKQGTEWIEHAAWCLTTAAKAFLADDDPHGAAIARARLAASVLLPAGHHDEAIDHLDHVIGDETAERSLVAMALAHRSRAHAACGRVVRANADIVEASRLARSLGNATIVNFTTRVRREIRSIDTSTNGSWSASAPSSVDNGSDDAPAADVEIRVLGGFSVTIDDEPSKIRKGLSTQLVKVVAVRGGHVHQREVARALWPESDPSSTVRRIEGLRVQLGLPQEIIERDGDFLRLSQGIQVDATTFEHLAREAQNGGTDIEPIAARAALEHYGELLPNDDAAWVLAARDRLRKLALRMLEGLTDDALLRGDHAEALRWAKQARDIDPGSADWTARVDELAAGTQ